MQGKDTIKSTFDQLFEPIFSQSCLYEPFPFFVRRLYRKPERFSKGRRKIDHERIYQETLRQVIAGEAEHLDDLTYCP
jgi:hypothetical protein